MTLASIETDTEQLTMTIVAEFDADAAAVWELWSDPRLLERWWGPPTHPATFVDHELAPGATSSYFMSAPDGQRFHGWWRMLTVEPLESLTLVDGFADESGVPNDELPTTEMTMSITDRPEGGTRMVIESTYPSAEAMVQLMEMGMEEGITAAIGQMDGLLLG